jgi:hypothetical protein
MLGHMSWIGRIAFSLVAVGGAVLFFIARESGKDSTDGQEALVLPFVVFWTLVALGVVWFADWLIRDMRQRSNRRD